MAQEKIDCAPARGTSGRIEGGLYLLLSAAFPAWRTSIGALEVKKVAEALQSSREVIYRWLRSDRIPPQRAKQLVALSEGRLREGDFLPYIFG